MYYIHYIKQLTWPKLNEQSTLGQGADYQGQKSITGYVMSQYSKRPGGGLAQYPLSDGWTSSWKPKRYTARMLVVELFVLSAMLITFFRKLHK